MHKVTAKWLISSSFLPKLMQSDMYATVTHDLYDDRFKFLVSHTTQILRSEVTQESKDNGKNRLLQIFVNFYHTLYFIC